MNFGEGGFDLEDHLQNMRAGRVAQEKQEQLEAIAEEEEKVDVYDLQRLADKLGVALKIDIKSDRVARDQEKIDKEYRRLKAIEQEREVVPEAERENVKAAKSDADERPVARRTGRVRKQVDRGAMVNTEADKKQRKQSKKEGGGNQFRIPLSPVLSKRVLKEMEEDKEKKKKADQRAATMIANKAMLNIGVGESLKPRRSERLRKGKQ